MRSLPSSAEVRIRDLTSELLLDLHLRRGAFWEAVGDIRARWRIEAVTQLPPDIHYTAVYTPRGHPEFDRPDDKEDYGRTPHHGWREELRILYDQAIPEDCHVGDELHSRAIWEMFLSACVVFDPPVPGLVEFRNSFDFGLLGGPESPAGGSPFGMVAPPLVQETRDAEKAARAQEEYYLRMIVYLFERYIEPQGLDFREVIADAFEKVPWPDPAEWEHEEPRWFIEVKPHHTEDDARNAFRMLAAAHAERPKIGRPRRDSLMAIEAAILHDRHDWTYEHLANHYGWQEYALASKYVKDGREILKI